MRLGTRAWRRKEHATLTEKIAELRRTDPSMIAIDSALAGDAHGAVEADLIACGVEESDRLIFHKGFDGGKMSANDLGRMRSVVAAILPRVPSAVRHYFALSKMRDELEPIDPYVKPTRDQPSRSSKRAGRIAAERAKRVTVQG